MLFDVTGLGPGGRVLKGWRSNHLRNEGKKGPVAWCTAQSTYGSFAAYLTVLCDSTRIGVAHSQQSCDPCVCLSASLCGPGSYAQGGQGAIGQGHPHRIRGPRSQRTKPQPVETVRRSLFMYIYTYLYLWVVGRSSVVPSWVLTSWYLTCLMDVFWLLDIVQAAGLESAATRQASVPQGHSGATLPPAAGE